MNTDSHQSDFGRKGWGAHRTPRAVCFWRGSHPDSLRGRDACAAAESIHRGGFSFLNRRPFLCHSYIYFRVIRVFRSCISPPRPSRSSCPSCLNYFLSFPGCWIFLVSAEPPPKDEFTVSKPHSLGRGAPQLTGEEIAYRTAWSLPVVDNRIFRAYVHYPIWRPMPQSKEASERERR